MTPECIIVSYETVFRFSVTDKGIYDCDYFWTDASIFVENPFFKYKTSHYCFEFFELVHMRDKLTSLLNDEITIIETIEFIEPDVQIVLHPMHDRRNDDDSSYIKEGYEIEDISAHFKFFPFHYGSILTEEHYVVPLYRGDIKELVSYLNEMIEILQ